MTIDVDRDHPAGPAPDATMAAGGPGGARVKGLTALALAITAPLLAACGPAAGQAFAATISKTCTAVSATLSDGPDPGADPVGYAEAQVVPLRAIRPAGRALRTATADLARAYAKVFASDGKSEPAARAVTAAGKKLNAVCPAAAS